MLVIKVPLVFILSGKMQEGLWTSHDCYNWTAWISQTSNSRNGSVASSDGKNNFGCYHTINPLHRCTSGDDATTQWWFAEQ